jgi:monomeric sarcosine oxidase
LHIVQQQPVVIVGAGIIGLSTAYALLKQGLRKVIVLEQASVDHSQAASHGVSRLLRFEYGADKLYSEMVRLSLQRWRNLAHETQQTLYSQTGLLVLGNEDDRETQASYHVLRELGLAPERLARRSCNLRFPQFATQAHNIFTYNTNAGILHASTCLQTLKKCILALGGEIREQCQVIYVAHDNRLQPIRLQLAMGDEITAERVIFATGSWVHRLLGDIDLPVRLTRQYLLYFANLPISAFGIGSFPAFIADELYGFPIHDHTSRSATGWLKAASHTFGSPVEAGSTPALEVHVIKQATKRLCELLPALCNAELAHVDSCIYDVSLDEDFILDYVPQDTRMIFASGFTGHGFKFGLLLGEMLASLLCETQTVVPLQRFQLARFNQSWRTATHSVA